MSNNPIIKEKGSVIPIYMSLKTGHGSSPAMTVQEKTEHGS